MTHILHARVLPTGTPAPPCRWTGQQPATTPAQPAAAAPVVVHESKRRWSRCTGCGKRGCTL